MPEDPELDQDGNPIVKVDNKLEAPEYKPPELNMAEALPPEYREKPYFKDKSFVDVVKEHDNLQTLLGKRPEGIPTPESSEEDWGKFLTSLRPETAEEYEFPETEFSKAKGRSEEYLKSVKDILFNADLNKRQASKIMEGFESLAGKAQAGQDTTTAEQAKVREAEFEELLNKTYTDQKQTVIDRTKKLMTDSVDAGLKDKVVEVLKDIPNDTLFVLTAVLDGVYKKHIAEDSPPGDFEGSSGDAVGWQAEAEKLMRSAAYSDFRVAGHDEARQRVTELFGKIAAAKK